VEEGVGEAGRDEGWGEKGRDENGRGTGGKGKVIILCQPFPCRVQYEGLLSAMDVHRC